MSALEKLREVTKAEPCPICSKPDWCAWLPDGAVVCGRVDIPPEGWQRAEKKARDGRNVFQPIRTYLKPRENRVLPTWKRTGKHDGSAFEMEIIFQYSETQRVIRKQWSDRREVYSTKRQPKPKSKLVVPQFYDGQAWQWGKGEGIWPLYRANDVTSDDVLFFVGGETSVETLRKLGFSAVCQQGGEGNYLDQVVANLKAITFRSLIILPDNDRTGRRQAKTLHRACSSAGIPAAVLEPYELDESIPPKWDVADWGTDEPQEKQKALLGAVSEIELTWSQDAKTGNTLEDVRSAVAKYAETDGEFERFLLEREIRSDFGLGGRRLSVLENLVKPEDLQIKPIDDTAAMFLDRLEQKSQGLIESGLPCGFADFDALTQGFQRTDLVVVAGRPSMGKSSWALQAAQGVAKISKLPVAIFSLEMSVEQVQQRMIAARSEIDFVRLRTGRLRENDWAHVAMAANEIFSLPLWIDESKSVSPKYIYNACNAIMEQTGKQLGLVLIDYVNNMQPSLGASGSFYQDMSTLVDECKNMMGHGRFKLAGESTDGLNAPCLLLSQLSRGVESRNDHRPVMSDLRESGKIEEVADIVAFMYRDEIYNPDTPERGIAEMIFRKHRNGPTGTLKFLFEPQYTRFRNLARID
jgi:replicative DNA helicase